MNGDAASGQRRATFQRKAVSRPLGPLATALQDAKRSPVRSNVAKLLECASALALWISRWIVPQSHCVRRHPVSPSKAVERHRKTLARAPARLEVAKLVKRPLDNDLEIKAVTREDSGMGKHNRCSQHDERAAKPSETSGGAGGA